MSNFTFMIYTLSESEWRDSNCSEERGPTMERMTIYSKWQWDAKYCRRRIHSSSQKELRVLACKDTRKPWGHQGQTPEWMMRQPQLFRLVLGGTSRSQRHRTVAIQILMLIISRSSLSFKPGLCLSRSSIVVFCPVLCIPLLEWFGTRDLFFPGVSLSHAVNAFTYTFTSRTYTERNPWKPGTVYLRKWLFVQYLASAIIIISHRVSDFADRFIVC